MGEADLEMYYGRHQAAIRIPPETGIAIDEKENASFNAALKQVALAEAYLAIGDRGRAGRRRPPVPPAWRS